MFRYIHYELQTCVLYKMLLQKASIDRLLYLGNSASVDCISYICNMHSKNKYTHNCIKKFSILIFLYFCLVVFCTKDIVAMLFLC